VAIEVDQKLQEAWCGHPYWIQIGNSNCDFKKKMKRTGEAVLHLLGQVSTLTFYKKFILKNQICKDQMFGVWVLLFLGVN
jgi:hypothetical protein